MGPTETRQFVLLLVMDGFVVPAYIYKSSILPFGKERSMVNI